MARRKNEQDVDTEMFSSDGVLTSQELSDVMKMAGQIYANGLSNVFSPQLSHSNIVGKNNQQVIPDKKKLQKDILSYPENEDVLRAYSEFAQAYSPLYSRTLDYYANMLNFDLDITCRNASQEDYASKEYQEDLKRVYKFLDKFQYKQHFKSVVREVLRSGVYFGWFRNSQSATKYLTEDNGFITSKNGGRAYTLQSLPNNYCLITGQDENMYLYDLDCQLFFQPGVDIDCYDPIFKEYFKEVYGIDYTTYRSRYDKDNMYKPSNPLDKRDGVFAPFHQTSPLDGAVCVVWDYSNARAVPFLAPLLEEILTDKEMAALQKNANMLGAKAILYGDIGTLDHQKSGQTQDALKLMPKTLTKFLSLVKAGLNESITVAAMPTEGTKFAQWDATKSDNIYGSHLATTAGNAASASRIIYSTDKAGQFEIQAQITSDYNRVAPLYEQFNNILNLYANRVTRKYKFNFKFSGSTYAFMREAVNKTLMDLANVGLVLNASAYSKIVDMQPNDFDRMLEEAKYGTLTNKLTPLMSLHNQSANQNAGRPTESISDRSESANENYE